MGLIRAARREDAPALGAVLSDWIDGTDWMPRLHTREQDTGFVAHLTENAQVFVAEKDTRPVGFLCCEDEELTALYLAEDARGIGIGAMMLEQAKQLQDRLTLWTFQMNAGAIRFYERHGFVEVDRSEGVNAEGLPDIEMAWERT